MHRGFYATDETSLSLAFSQIIADSVLVEVCDNVDNDCDTLIDEGFQKYCNRPAGITMSTLCMDPGDPCNGVDDNCFMGIADEMRNPCGLCGPTPAEICDGLDNNCNGLVDEGGVCMGCIPDPEICDGGDDDCDTRIDEGLTRPCGSDVGECSPGIETCAAGAWGGCTGVGPRPETCNNRDDDCDGVIDGLTRACGSTDVGVCQFGTEVCTAGMFGMCTGSIGPTPEVCDTEDDDCDTRTDEGTGGGTCGSMIGECRPGSLSCMGGALICTGGVSPSPETCNGRDDDCDGPIDEGVPPGAACGSDVGECDPGLLRCMGGSFVCTGAIGSTPEVCDGEDDDCDTRVDEGNPGGGLPCGTDEG
jgi:hypothetical protein